MKIKTNLVLVFLLLTVFSMLVSCQEQKAEWKGKIEEVDGVTVVKNPKEPIYGQDVFSIEEELSIRESEGRYIAKTPLKHRPFVLKKNKLYTVEEDEEGYQVVKQYNINWRTH